jgi:hypothetical protein
MSNVEKITKEADLMFDILLHIAKDAGITSLSIKKEVDTVGDDIDIIIRTDDVGISISENAKDKKIGYLVVSFKYHSARNYPDGSGEPPNEEIIEHDLYHNQFAAMQHMLNLHCKTEICQAVQNLQIEKDFKDKDNEN